ncbi:MAG: BamA/TamA family outer membrane protein [Anaeromyxobacter sp.]
MPAPLPAFLLAALLTAQAPIAPGGAPPAGTGDAAEAAPADAVQAPAPPPDAAPPGSPPAAARTITPRHVIERIELRGLTHTRELAVRRHLLVTEGDLLDPERVLLSRLRLLQLGWFSSVESRVERGSERGLVVLVMELQERNTILINDFVFGSTGPQPLYGGVGVSQQNFLGRGLGLTGAFVYGGSPADRPDNPSRFTVRANFFAPDIWVKGLPPMVVGASGLFLQGEEFTCGDPDCQAYGDRYATAPRIQYQRAGGELTLGVRPGPFERLLATYRFEHLRADSAGDAAAPEAAGPYLLMGSSNVASVTGTYEVDTRDDFFLPREGFRGMAQVTFASALFGGDYEYSRYLAQVDTAYALFRLPLRAQLAVGAVQGQAPFFDRFYPADFSYFAIGPALGRALELNFSTDSRYDAFVAAGGLEYALPLWSSRGFFHRGYLALGARGVWSSATLGGGRTPFSKSPFSADVALRFDTPVGTFNASLGYALDNAL